MPNYVGNLELYLDYNNGYMVLSVANTDHEICGAYVGRHGLVEDPEDAVVLMPSKNGGILTLKEALKKNDSRYNRNDTLRSGGGEEDSGDGQNP